METLPKIKKEYIDKGIVKLVFVPFPLEAKSMQVTMLSECMNRDKYFDFVDLMFKKQREWGLARNSENIILKYASLNGLSEKKAKECMKNDDLAREIIANRQMGMDNFKIQGTPSFLFAYKNDREMHYGAPSFETIQKMVETHLGSETKISTKK